MDAACVPEVYLNLSKEAQSMENLAPELRSEREAPNAEPRLGASPEEKPGLVWLGQPRSAAKIVIHLSQSM